MKVSEVVVRILENERVTNAFGIQEQVLIQFIGILEYSKKSNILQ